MDLDMLKTSWQTLDQRLAFDQRLQQLEQTRHRRLSRTRSNLRWLVWGQTAQIVFALPFLALAALLWASEPAHASVVVAGIVLQAYSIATIIAAGLVLGQLGRIDYAAPVLEIQQQLGRARTLYVRSGMVAGLPWWGLWIVILMVLAGLRDVSLLDQAPAMVWSGVGIAVAGLLATAWFHRWARRPERAAFGQRMDDSLTGSRLRRALAELEELRRFSEAPTDDTAPRA